MGFINSGRVGQDFTVNTVDPTETVGALFSGSDGVYQYIKGEGTILAGQFLLVDENGDATGLTTTNSGALPQAVGVAVCDLTDEYYGYVWRGCGSFEAIVTNAVAAGTQLTTTASAGVAGTGGDTIQGLRNVDAGVTDTRVTVFAATLMTTNC